MLSASVRTGIVHHECTGNRAETATSVVLKPVLLQLNPASPHREGYIARWAP